jgi:hypothetical protein
VRDSRCGCSNHRNQVNNIILGGGKFHPPNLATIYIPPPFGELLLSPITSYIVSLAYSSPTTVRRLVTLITENRLALSIIVVLSLSSMTGCGGGGSGDPVVSTSATPTATVTGLAPNTLYYFAVSAYNGLSGPCSNEVSTVTPDSGAVFLAWDAVQGPTVSVYDVHYGRQSSGQPADCTYPDVLRVPAPF